MAQQWILAKHRELHGDLPDVPPTRYPYEAWRELWSAKGFEPCDEDGEFVDDPADADPERQDVRAAAKRDARLAKRGKTSTQDKPAGSSEKGA